MANLQSLVSSAFLAFSVSMASSACSDRQSSPARSKTETTQISSDSSVFPPHEHDTIDAPKGVLEVNDVRARLEKAGIAPVSEEGGVRLAFLGGEGSRLVFPAGEILVYIYADALARARETDLIDSVRVAPAGGHVDWRMPASILVLNNVALVVLTNDEGLRKRIHAAVRQHDLGQRRAAFPESHP